MRVFLWVLQLPLRFAVGPLVFILSLTRIGWTLVAGCVIVGFVAIRAGGNLPYLLTLVLCSALLIVWFFARATLRNILMQRTLPERVEAGELFPVRLMARNEKRLFPSGAIHVRERPTEPTLSRGGWAYFPSLPPTREKRARYVTSIRRRGVHTFRPAEFSSVWPLGFFRTRAVCEVNSEIIVTPRMGQVNESFTEELERFFRRFHSTRPCAWEEDFRGLREYRPGDSPRRIHWRTSARYGNLLVKEFEHPETRRLTLLLDTNLARDEEPGRASGLRPGITGRREAHLELAISLAATLARDGLQRNCRVALAAFAPRFLRVEVSPENRNLGGLLEELAFLRPHPRTVRARTLEELLQFLPPGDLAGSAVVLISLGSLPGRPEGVDTELFRRTDNHVRLVDVSDPAFPELFRRNPLPDEQPPPAPPAPPPTEGAGDEAANSASPPLQEKEVVRQ